MHASPIPINKYPHVRQILKSVSSISSKSFCAQCFLVAQGAINETTILVPYSNRITTGPDVAQVGATISRATITIIAALASQLHHLASTRADRVDCQNAVGIPRGVESEPSTNPVAFGPLGPTVRYQLMRPFPFDFRAIHGNSDRHCYTFRVSVLLASNDVRRANTIGMVQDFVKRRRSTNRQATPSIRIQIHGNPVCATGSFSAVQENSVFLRPRSRLLDIASAMRAVLATAVRSP